MASRVHRSANWEAGWSSGVAWAIHSDTHLIEDGQMAVDQRLLGGRTIDILWGDFARESLSVLVLSGSDHDRHAAIVTLLVAPSQWPGTWSATCKLARTLE